MLRTFRLPECAVLESSSTKRRGGYPPWTDDDMAKFEARWPRGTRERVLFVIPRYTVYGSRRRRP